MFELLNKAIEETGLEESVSPNTYSSRRKYTLNEHIFDAIDTPAKAYWLGYLYCDGNVDKIEPTISLFSKDEDQISKFHCFIETDRPFRQIVTEINGKHYVGFNQCMYSKHMVQTLVRYGIIPNKSHDHSVPVYIPPGKLERHFWRGCIDADGSIAWNKYYYYAKLVSGEKKRYGPSQRIIMTLSNRNNQLLENCCSYFGKGNVSEMDKKNHSGNWMWFEGPATPKGIFPLLDNLYKNSIEDIRMGRKYQKYLEVKSFVERKTINNQGDQNGVY